MGTLPVISPVETSLAMQVITRSAGIGRWNCPCGITTMGVPIPAAEGGAGAVARNGAMPGQLMRLVALCGLCGVSAAAAVPPLASAQAAAAATMMTMRRVRVLLP